MGDREDFTTRSDIDIVAQSINDLKSKNAWEAYELVSNVETRVLAGTTELTLFSGKGEIVSATLDITSSAALNTYNILFFYVDNTLIDIYKFESTIIYNLSNTKKLFTPVYISNTNTQIILELNTKFFINTSYRIDFVTETSDTITLISTHRIGKNN